MCVVTKQRCSKCKEMKLLKHFTKNRSRLLGHNPYCRQCQAVYTLAYRKTKKGKMALDLAYKKWAQSQTGRRTRHRINRKYLDMYPERCRARSAVKQATINGTLVRPKSCSNCGIDGKVHAHHEDYDKPLDVVWLCPSCHKLLCKTDPR